MLMDSGSFMWTFSGSEIGGEYGHESVSGYSDPNNVVEVFQAEDTSLDHDNLDLQSSSNVLGPVIQTPDMSKRLDRGYAGENGSSEYSILRYINQVLMEDDLEDEDCAIEDSTLHAAEQYFYETLSCSSCGIDTNNLVESGIVSDLSKHNFYLSHIPHVKNTFLTNPRSFCSSHSTAPSVEEFLVKAPRESQSDWESNGGTEGKGKAKLEKEGGDLPDSLVRGRKSVQREIRSNYLEEGKSKKHLALYDNKEIILHELFDKVLSLYDHESEDSSVGIHDGALPNGESSKQKEPEKGSHGEITSCNKKGISKRKAIDMRSLLIQCMTSVAGNDHSTARKQLRNIRLLCSPLGDGSQRLAHYFANALEARLVGLETPKYKFSFARSDADILKTHKLYRSQLPHQQTSMFFPNQVILKLAEKASSLHIIHFGIMYGMEWPPLIHRLSTRPGGPPKLRITGIELPQTGFRPAARVKETGCRLANYCKRFNVPFEYNGLAQQWETVSIEDLRIEKDEVLVVNCLYQLMLLYDDTIVEQSPRDAILKLIKRINPEMFIHGIVNGSINSPFFTSRFREALFYHSSLFDMFEAYFPRDNEERKMFEEDILGNQIMNAIACEGLERVYRPETYKQWQTRTLRAGFRQLPLNQEIMKNLRTKFKTSYHKDFFVDEASQWLLVGWKERVLTAFSCWKPT